MTDCNPTILKAELQSLSVINERLNCEIGNLKIELETLRQENSRLREALRLLYDNQNGPPLYKYRKQWTEAMRLASELLGIETDLYEPS